MTRKAEYDTVRRCSVLSKIKWRSPDICSWSTQTLQWKFFGFYPSPIPESRAPQRQTYLVIWFIHITNTGHSQKINTIQKSVRKYIKVPEKQKTHIYLHIHPTFFASSTSKFRQKCKKSRNAKKKAENAFQFENSCKKRQKCVFNLEIQTQKMEKKKAHLFG